jgi:hypothetical protein
MRFFAKHVTVVGDIQNFAVEQTKAKKHKIGIGGGLGAFFNLEVGLI